MRRNSRPDSTSRLMRAAFATLLTGAALLLATPSRAQTPSATIVGRIVDATDLAVSGATVRVRNIDTNELRTAESQSNGDYTVSNLRPGTYEVVIEKPGFKQLRQSNLDLQVEQTARMDARLQLGGLSDSVEVQADVPLMNTETSSRGDVVSAREITEIPLNGRDFNDLAATLPGVMPSEQSSKGSPFSINGARADASNILIDGQNNQNPRDAGAQLRPPLDALQEFKIHTSGYSAEYGRLAGGVVSMLLKTGGNRLRASASEFLRNDRFDARNFFDAEKSELSRHQFGATVSGPVVIPRLYDGHDHTFFMVSWESLRETAGENNIGIVPTALERSGDFSQSVDASGNLIRIKDPLASGACSATSSSGCFPGNRIPASRISPIALQLLPFFPDPNRQGPSNHLANLPGRDHADNLVLKLDHGLSARDNASVRVLLRRQSSTNPFSGSNLGGFGSATENRQSLYGFSETHIFSAAVVNELRAGLTRTTNEQLSDHAGTNWAAQLGIPGTTDDPSLAGFPRFTITGFDAIGDSATNPIRYVVNNYNVSDAMTWIHGNHSVKIGGEMLHTQYFQPTNSNFNGTFTFNGRLTNSGFADFLLGYASSTSRKIGTVTNHLYTNSFGAYVQDDYKVRPDLTLNLGLRYEVQTSPYEKDGQMTNFVPSTGMVLMGGDSTVPNWPATVASAGLTGRVALASDYGLPKSLVNTNYLNFAPRIGFAWRPFGGNKTVIRSGYGIFYTGSRMSAIRTDLAGGFPFSVSQSFTGATSDPTRLTLSNPFPDAFARVTGVTTANGYEVDAPSPYLQSWNLTLERELRGVGFELGYTGSKGTHLGRKYNLNQQVRTPTSTSRPYDGFSGIQYYSFGTNSSYNAATLTVRKRFHKGLLFRANYTFGKSIDVASGLNYAGDGGYQGAQDSYNPDAERGRSDYDVRHLFSMSFAWPLPLSSHEPLKGWALSGSGRIYSGQPLTPQLSGPSADLAQATRPDRIAKGTVPNPSPERWFDLAAFPVVPDSAFRFGDSGRNILDGPGTVSVNLALSKSVPLGPGRLQLRSEAFNVTNHTNFSLPNVALDRANAGTITASKPARIIQFGLRWDF
jgi:outer membrane receptor protein involved in Fe transport